MVEFFSRSRFFIIRGVIMFKGAFSLISKNTIFTSDESESSTKKFTAAYQLASQIVAASAPVSNPEIFMCMSHELNRDIVSINNVVISESPVLYATPSSTPVIYSDPEFFPAFDRSIHIGFSNRDLSDVTTFKAWQEATFHSIPITINHISVIDKIRIAISDRRYIFQNNKMYLSVCVHLAGIQLPGNTDYEIPFKLYPSATYGATIAFGTSFNIFIEGLLESAKKGK